MVLNLSNAVTLCRVPRVMVTPVTLLLLIEIRNLSVNVYFLMVLGNPVKGS